MNDDISTRQDIEQDIDDLKNNPVADYVKDRAQEEIGNRIQQAIADMAADQAGSSMAGEAVAAGATAAGSEVISTGAGASTTAAAETAAGAGTAAAAGETAAAASATTAGAAAAEGAVAGSVGGPVGAAIGALVGIAVSLAKKAHDSSKISIDKDDDSAPKFNVFVWAIIAVLFMFAFCGVLMSQGMTSVFSIAHESEFEEDIVNGEQMADAGERFKEGTELKPYNYKKPLRNSIYLYVYGKDGKGIHDGMRATLDKAIKYHCKNLIKDLDSKTGSINGHPYDDERSLKTFYENRYPYDLATASFKPKVGDVLHEEGYSQTYKARYDDVNWAEILTVLCQSKAVEGSAYGMTWGNANYEDLMAYLQKEVCIKHMYELGLKWTPVYRGSKEYTDDFGETQVKTVVAEPYEYDSPDECRGAPETVISDGVECKWEEYYVKVKVKPFGLRELYNMAFNPETKKDTDAWKYAYADHYRFYAHKNINMLNYSERVTRLYQRKLKIKMLNIAGEEYNELDALGISYKEPRSIYSSIYNEVKNDGFLKTRHEEGKGRSCWYYIQKNWATKFSGVELDKSVENKNGIPKPKPGYDYPVTDKAKLLAMIQYYLNQGDYKGIKRGASNETISKSGCLDCTIAMIASYYLGRQVDVTEVSQFVNSEGQLDTKAALAHFGLTQGGNMYSDPLNYAVNEINNNRPCILHIRGFWQSDDGTVLHSTQNGHFMVCTGYDETGLYVMDPGRRANKHISYEDWAKVNDFYVRPVYPV